jgi:hypothetical protein
MGLDGLDSSGLASWPYTSLAAEIVEGNAQETIQYFGASVQWMSGRVW